MNNNFKNLGNPSKRLPKARNKRFNTNHKKLDTTFGNNNVKDPFDRPLDMLDDFGGDFGGKAQADGIGFKGFQEPKAQKHKSLFDGFGGDMIKGFSDFTKDGERDITDLSKNTKNFKSKIIKSGKDNFGF